MNNTTIQEVEQQLQPEFHKKKEPKRLGVPGIALLIILMSFIALLIWNINIYLKKNKIDKKRKIISLFISLIAIIICIVGIYLVIKWRINPYPQ